jgi:hypothetical protein
VGGGAGRSRLARHGSFFPTDPAVLWPLALVGASFAGHPSRSATTGHALTFNPDHLMGAGQQGKGGLWKGRTQAHAIEKISS